MAGWITLIGGTIGGVALSFVGLSNETTVCDGLGCREDFDPDWALMGLGVSTMLVSNVVGLIMAVWGDDAEVTVE